MKYIISIFLLLAIIYPRRESNLSNSHVHNLDNNRSCGERPISDYSTLSPSGKFMIHFNDYYNGIEDYANSVALSADSSRKVIVDIMNFRSEISDEDSIYDIYIEELPNGSYGWNCPDDELGSSWIEIDDNYVGSNYSTTGKDAMRISIAHEFFHAIQRAYIPSPGSNSFFYELSSMWIEDIIYPDINDYINFSQIGDDYFSNPTNNMNQYNGYGLGLYPHYLNFVFDNQIMQRIWEQLSIDADVFNAINNVLNDSQYNYNSSFVETWIDFNTRNLFNGLFDNMNNEIYYYEDQILFNPIATNILDINGYLEPGLDEWEAFEYETNVNNKSVEIRSFSPTQTNPQQFLFNVNQNNSFTSFSLISDNQDQIEFLSAENYNTLNYILDDDDIFHFVYISDDNSNSINTIIQKRDKDISYEVDCYPNPINIDQNLTLKLSSSIEVSNLKVDIFNINGQLIQSFDLGNFSYSNHDFNEVSFTPFNSFLSSGVYILKLYLDDYIVSKKIVYLK